MKGRIYRFVSALGRALGLWAAAAVVWVVTTWWFLFMVRRTAASVRFYRALFPQRGFLGRLRLTWRQFHHFSTVYVDRLRFEREGRVDWTAEGREAVLAAARAGKYGIFLTTHFGNWEAAARGFAGLGVRILLYMGARQFEEIDAQIRSDMQRDGVSVIAVPEGESAPFEGIEGLRFLKDRGFVAMAGDRLWGPGQATETVRFLGREVRLPQAPYAFALVTGAPIFVFFVLRTGRATYRIVAHPPMFVRAESRGQRGEAMRRAAQRYAEVLEETLREHPEHWYHFEPLWGG